MTTSISSEAKKNQSCILIRGDENRAFNIFTFLPFVAKPADQWTKYLQNRCSYIRGICTQKIGVISQLEADKIMLSPKCG